MGTLESILATLDEINHHGTVLAMVGFLAGTLVTNWLSTARDKRASYNAAVTPVREKLVSDRERPTPFDPAPTAVELDRAYRVMGPLKRRNFKQALNQVCAARKAATRRGSAGDIFYNDDIAIQQAIDAAIRIL